MLFSFNSSRLSQRDEKMNGYLEEWVSGRANGPAPFQMDAGRWPSKIAKNKKPCRSERQGLL
jgi:hypothetical protein